MYYRIKNDNVYDYADYEYESDCLVTDLCTMAEFQQYPGKWIVGEVEEEVEVIDYDDEGNPIGSHTETKVVARLIPNPNWEKEQEQKEKERIARLSLTKREVFLALYRAKGITPDQIKAQIQDPEALIEFEYATEYYRFNPLINVIGGQLGYTAEDLDYLFINKKLPGQDELQEEGEGDGQDE